MKKPNFEEIAEKERREQVYYYNLDDLPLSEPQKECVLEWFARKLWIMLEEGSEEPDYYCKSYDPLRIEGKEAHSYVFSLGDGGRHHDFKNLAHLEKMLVEEGISSVKTLRWEERNLRE